MCANRSENNHIRKQGTGTGTRGGRDNQWGKFQVLGVLIAVKSRVVS